jgi:hypothetical protein
MAISITRYVDVTSNVGGTTVASTREFVGRIMTGNVLLPPQTMVSFTSSSEVGDYFGYSSEEYYRALFYFSWTSKYQVQASSLQFARWVNVGTAPYIFPLKSNGTVLANWVTIISGSFVLTMGGSTFTLSELDFSECENLASVATVIQTAIQAQTLGGDVWTDALVTYSSTYQGFILTGGAVDAVTNPVAVTVGGDGTDITPEGLLGWIPEQEIISGALISGAIWAPGSEQETIVEALQASYDASNNFGSFLFLNNLSVSISQAELAAEWNAALNVTLMYCQKVTTSQVVSWYEALNSYSGTALTLSGLTSSQIGKITNGSSSVINLASTTGLLPGQTVSGTGIPSGTVISSIVSATQINLSQAATLTASESITFTLVQFPEQIPMMIFAATDYFSTTLSVNNYEFNQFSGVSASVSDDSTANAYDALSINYYGVTQQAGQKISFYQQGYLQGGLTDIVDMCAYTNEVWLRDYAQTQLFNLLLSSGQVPANTSGQALISVTLQAVINQALVNGVISVGKTLNQIQINAITQKTGDSKAWQTVQNSGYWLDVAITSLDSKYIAVYTLVYSKDDVIRFIKGQHELI